MTVMRKLYSLLTLTLCLALAGPVAAAPADDKGDLAAISSAAGRENPSAQLMLGLAYLEGRYGLTPDPAKAVFWLRRAARNDQHYAQDELGGLYAAGRGVAKDPTHAVYWWQRAAAAGNADAQYHLGQALLLGDGVARDPAAAAQWLAKAADQGNRDARYLLGRMYVEGYGVPEDRDLGRTWLGRAAAQGQSDALKLLNLMVNLGHDTSAAYLQSAEVLERRARGGDPEAEYELGLRYESGAWDVLQDNAKAVTWLTRAARAGNRHAMAALAHIYERGALGVPADAALARQWRARANATPQ